MKKYLQLVNFEFNRIVKLFTVLLGITFVAQMIGVVVQSRSYLNLANEKMYKEMMPQAEFLESFGQMSFLQIAKSSWFFGPIALCVAGVAFYIFFIWYRDWIGKNTFIYRLLMLPTSRLNIFFAKITTILLMTFGFVAVQLIMIPIEIMVLKAMVPNEFRLDLGVMEVVTSIPELTLIFPSSIMEFIFNYGLGLLAVSVLFTGILFERSYKWKGILAGLLYGALAVVVLLLPLLLHEFVLNNFFYPIELLVLEIIMGLLVLSASIWVSGFLLKKKVTV
ncbi:hypothetical protein [Mesobacillus maritimus]|uniref:ABC transporter permease n=1 Tax=Mesobacillus maritimus TaxID=1643336 RepID=A0ABS7K940_9BACI|nr:hypothetical protein [Mesobacillus maritimus]MBY0098759.1 hypothetical protein [Mesobacillus maritimus]